jgi:hypothetical protein
MGKKIVTTPLFRKKVSNVVKYVQSEFGNKAMLDFIAKLDQHIQKALIYPTTGIASRKDSTVRYIIVKPHNKLYYKTYPSRIILLDLFDMRQHPSKNPFQ